FTVLPFARPAYDPASLLAVVAVTSDGSPAPPSFKKLWSRAFDSDDIPGLNDRNVKEPEEEGTIDAAWLAERLLSTPQRRQCIERLAFGQRLFGAVPPDELQDVLVAMRGFGRFPAAMVTLERIGIRDPKVYVAAVRRARGLEEIDNPS